MSVKRKTISAVAVLLLLSVSVFADARADTEQASEGESELRAGLLREDDVGAPRRHFRMRAAAKLSVQEASRLYGLVKGALAKGYASSGFEGVEDYQALKRYNTAPYLSATHGNHYLNNYANGVAAQYGAFEEAGELPAGSILYKDSFSVTDTHQPFSFTDARQIVLGPLFIMRKMEPGFNRVTGDWQYIQIQLDGTIVGMTGGKGAERVDYCIGCHLARESYDHLYYVPEAYRPDR